MSQTDDSRGITIDRVLQILDKGVIDSEHGLMRWSSNYTFLVTVTLGASSLMAIYKPQLGERPLWDFPDGTLCLRERAAFLTSEELGWQIVPPTVVREGPRGLGSLQFYVDHDPEVNYFSMDESLVPQLVRIAAFDYLVNNADRKGGHVLVDAQGHMWGIDHGITFNAAPKLRTVIWDFAGQPVPDPLLSDIERLAQSVDDASNPFRRAMAELVNNAEMAAFRKRISSLLRVKRFPEPGPTGPSYPWPPV